MSSGKEKQMYNAYITKIKNIRPHPNADRLNLGECFGNTVVIGKDYDENTLYAYFPTDGQLSTEYAVTNDLLRRKDDAGNPAGGYLDPDKRNIRAMKLRGEKSDGLVMPLSSFEYTGVDLSSLTEGTTINVLNGHEICTKYIPRTNKTNGEPIGNRTRNKKVPVAPLFAEHADTEQLAYNLSAFRPNDEIEITLKIHGTSQRTGYLPVFKGYKQDFWGRLLCCINTDKKMKPFVAKLYEKAIRNATPIYDWGYVSGTRRTVLNNYDGGYYGSNEFRETHSKFFEGKLQKGETVYYEVCGFTNTGVPIMSSCNNKKLNDKEFIKQYGEETVFSYGCSPDGTTELSMSETGLPYGAVVPRSQSDIYVYRMTITNEEGFVVEYTPDFMRYRCEQMGVKCVPTLWKGAIPNEESLKQLAFITDDIGEFKEWIPTSAGEYIKDIAEQYYDGPDPIGKTHIREGVVVRIINRPKFAAYKHKNFSFKVLEGIVKANAEAPDMEEAQEETTE